MQWIGWLGMALSVVMVVASKIGAPPVILEMGPLTPTAVPTMKPADRKRLITTITVQNNVAGESVISFECTDVADEGDGKTRTIASKNYPLSEDKPELRALQVKIVEDIRRLERDLLDYVERAGPPQARPPIGSQ